MDPGTPWLSFHDADRAFFEPDRLAHPRVRQTSGDRGRSPGDRSLGFQATIFALTNDEAGDARLVAELKRAEYDGVAIGGYINGQDAVNFPATAETTVWFNRVLNIVHAQAPNRKIILGRAEVQDGTTLLIGRSCLYATELGHSYCLARQSLLYEAFGLDIAH